MDVQDVMTPNFVAVPPEMTVDALVQLLAERHISGVFVVDGAGSPLGVVTEADLLRRLSPDEEDSDLGWLVRQLVNADHSAERYVRIHGTRARDVMTPAMLSVDVHEPVAAAARLIREHRIRQVAVLRDGRLAGVVSRADLLKALAQAPDRLATDRTDQRIHATIMAEMHRHPWGATHLVTVLVRDGVVRLEGYCRSDKVRQALRVLAERVDGVERVEDRLDLGTHWPAPESPILPPL